MSIPLSLRLIDEEAPVETPTTAVEPQIFVRTLSTPAGMPWDQARAAALDARLGAPLPLGEVAYQLKRLDSWSPGKPARWAAFYVRAQEIGEHFSAAPLVDGQPVAVEFLSDALRRRRSRKLLVVAAVAGGLVAAIIMSVGSVIAIRGGAAAELDAAEQMATSRLGQARALKKLRDQTRLLDAAGLRGRGLDTALSDIAWAATAKAPEAHIQALHWDHGLMAFEVRGETAPFTRLDRLVRKADKPASAGVSLWGVSPAGNGSALKATAAARDSGFDQ